MGRDLSPHIAGGCSRSVPRNSGKSARVASASPAITCITISNRADGCHGQRTGLPSCRRLPENKHAGRDGPTRRSRETMHGQTCMASAADNGVDQDFDQDRDPASVAGRPGPATAPSIAPHSVRATRSMAIRSSKQGVELPVAVDKPNDRRVHRWCRSRRHRNSRPIVLRTSLRTR
jgi:hypothetical protein